MPFAKGRSGNPGGRPKALVEVQEAARAHTAEAVATLARICSDATAPPAAQVSAATALLDRGWGRPVQAIEATETPLPEPLFDSNTLPEHLREAWEDILLLMDTTGRRWDAATLNGDEAAPGASRR
jgi:hypothetical protein